MERSRLNPQNGDQYKSQDSNGIDIYMNGWSTVYMLRIMRNGDLINTDSVKDSYTEDFSEIGVVKYVTMNDIDITTTAYNEQTGVVSISDVIGNIVVEIQ